MSLSSSNNASSFIICKPQAFREVNVQSAEFNNSDIISHFPDRCQHQFKLCSCISILSIQVSFLTSNSDKYIPKITCMSLHIDLWSAILVLGICSLFIFVALYFYACAHVSLFLNNSCVYAYIFMVCCFKIAINYPFFFATCYEFLAIYVASI